MDERTIGPNLWPGHPVVFQFHQVSGGPRCFSVDHHSSGSHLGRIHGGSGAILAHRKRQRQQQQQHNFTLARKQQRLVCTVVVVGSGFLCHVLGVSVALFAHVTRVVAVWEALVDRHWPLLFRVGSLYRLVSTLLQMDDCATRSSGRYGRDGTARP